ncbi:carbohydrate sulfotransferase 10-like isoform X2 [Macrobrachium nipponense]|uniref:carbohydrate sulfotransferase 10-like isoform X2 n=1 Tax=Macrobrachium nipponense TaxID=159736 RepID=UPI0030C866DD
MAGENNAKPKFLRLLVLCVGLSLLAFSFLLHTQDLRIFSWAELGGGDHSQLATVAAASPGTRHHREGLSFVRANTDSYGDTENKSDKQLLREGRDYILSEKDNDDLPERTATLQPLASGATNRSSLVAGNDSKEQLEWEHTMETRFAERKDLLEEKCENYNGSIPKDVKRTLRDAFLYSRKYSFLICVTAKGGASTWKTHLLRMNGYTKYIEHPHETNLKKRMIAEKLLSSSELYRKMHREEEEVTRVISVRHPFSRLVSAYTDKFVNGSLSSPGKNKLNLYEIALRLMGKPVSPSVQVAVPFSVFLRSVIEENGGAVDMNRHWRPYSTNCRPCHVPFDYIVKLETFEEDLRYLVLKLGIKEINVTTQKNKSSKSKSPTYEAYYRNISDDIIARLYAIYKEDFRLFGYEVPQFVKEALSKTVR